jgi:hypothetical protein
MAGAVPVLVAALLVVALTACGASADPPGDAASAGHRRAKLTPAATDPFEVHGTGFAPHERVRVTVTESTGAEFHHRVRAGRGGSFTVRFPHASAAGGLNGVAAGSAGSHASFQFSTGIGG